MKQMESKKKNIIAIRQLYARKITIHECSHVRHVGRFEESYNFK